MQHIDCKYINERESIEHCDSVCKRRYGYMRAAIATVNVGKEFIWSCVRDVRLLYSNRFLAVNRAQSGSYMASWISIKSIFCWKLSHLPPWIASFQRWVFDDGHERSGSRQSGQAYTQYVHSFATRRLLLGSMIQNPKGNQFKILHNSFSNY